MTQYALVCQSCGAVLEETGDDATPEDAMELACVHDVCTECYAPDPVVESDDGWEDM